MSAASIQIVAVKVFRIYLVFTLLSACLGNMDGGYGVNDFIILIVTMLANFVLEFIFLEF